MKNGTTHTLWYIIPIFAIVIIFVSLGVYVNFFTGPQPTDGPLAKAAGTQSGYWTECVPVKTGEVTFFGSNRFPADSQHVLQDTITIMSVKPVKLPSGVHQVGMGTLEVGNKEVLGGPLQWVQNNFPHPVHKLPVTLVLNKTFYEPVITVVAQRPGVYTIPGLIVTYTDRGHKYSDYFPGQFQLAIQSTCPSNPPSSPTTVNGSVPRWLAWMKLPE